MLSDRQISLRHDHRRRVEHLCRVMKSTRHQSFGLSEVVSGARRAERSGGGKGPVSSVQITLSASRSAQGWPPLAAASSAALSAPP